MKLPRQLLFLWLPSRYKVTRSRNNLTLQGVNKKSLLIHCIQRFQSRRLHFTFVWCHFLTFWRVVGLIFCVLFKVLKYCWLTVALEDIIAPWFTRNWPLRVNQEKRSCVGNLLGTFWSKVSFRRSPCKRVRRKSLSSHISRAACPPPNHGQANKRTIIVAHYYTHYYPS